MTSLLVLTEGGSRVGLGHIRRCLTLAAAMRKVGVESYFRVAGGAAAEKVVSDAGFPVAAFVNPADAAEVSRLVSATAAAGVLIDSYGATADVFRACASKRTVAIDDLANRALPVDLVINSALGAVDLDYVRLTTARLLLGPRYALLRPEFEQPPNRAIRSVVERVLVTLGGGDHRALTRSVMQWCAAAAPAATVEVVVGPFSGQENELRSPGTDGRFIVLERADMREAMMRADLAICSGGQTLFELAATGLPGIAIATADNQVQNMTGFASAGTIRNAGSADDPQLRSRFAEAFEELGRAEARSDMSVLGPQIVDGQGADRTAHEIVALLRNSRSAMA